MYNRAATAAPVIRRATRRRGLWRLLLLGVILVILGSYVSPLRSYVQRAGQIRDEQAATASLQRQQQQLLDERNKLNDNNYVEQVARRDLGMVLPGEQAFVLKDVDPSDAQVSAPPAAPPKRSIIDRIEDWVGSLVP